MEMECLRDPQQSTLDCPGSSEHSCLMVAEQS